MPGPGFLAIFIDLHRTSAQIRDHNQTVHVIGTHCVGLSSCLMFLFQQFAKSEPFEFCPRPFQESDTTLMSELRQSMAAHKVKHVGKSNVQMRADFDEPSLRTSMTAALKQHFPKVVSKGV
jgi:hypothetical protein